MKYISLKTAVPAVLLILTAIALAVVTGYALSLKESVYESDSEIVSAASPTGMSAVLRTAVPVTPSPAPTIEPIPAVDADEQERSLSEIRSPYWSDGILFINDTYRSPTMSVTVKTVTDSEMFGKKLICYIADVHVADVTQIRTGCTSGNFSNAGRGPMEKTAKRENALAAISGDFCHALIIRNGEIYNKNKNTVRDDDVCLLLKNGEMEIVNGRSTGIEKILDKDPWQAWEFGPALFDSKGNPIRSFPPSDILESNPRSCIGYYEPGHYCFVVVDGRQKKSRGVTLSELALLMQSLGCKQAYNLDGGSTAHFYYKNAVLNHPSGGGRFVADIVYVAYEPYDESRFYFGKAGLSR